MYKSAFKHGPDPPATGLLKSMLSGSRNYCVKRGIVKRPLNVHEIHKLIISVWNKEELPEEWKESII